MVTWPRGGESGRRRTRKSIGNADIEGASPRAGYRALVFLIIIAVLFAGKIMFIGAAQEISAPASWQIVRDQGVREITIRFHDFETLGEESILCDQLANYLRSNRPNVVQARVRIITDFGTVRTRSPILSVDGISVEE